LFSDVFVVILTLTAFQITIKSPDKPFLPEDLYQIDLRFVLVWGLYANMIAQLLSQVTSSIIIQYHHSLVVYAADQVNGPLAQDEVNESALAENGVLAGAMPSPQKSPKENGATLQQDAKVAENGVTPDEEDAKVTENEVTSDEEDAKVADNGVTADKMEVTSSSSSKETSEDRERDGPLYQHAFTRPHRGESEKLQIRRWVNPGLLCTSLATVILVFVGCSLPSLTFESFGLLAIAVETGIDFAPAREQYSIFSIASFLMDQARFLGEAKHYIGLGTISSLLVITTLVVPTFLVLVTLAEWLLTLRPATRKRLRVISEILQSWQYIEVFVLSALVSAWQLGPTSNYIVNGYCGRLQPVFAMLVFYGLIEEEDAQCFSLKAELEPAIVILVVAAVLLFLLSLFVAKAANQRTRDDEDSLNSKDFARKSAESFEVDEMNIKPVPVLFTDTFRWLLSSSL
jgi:hypothetical protein